MTDNSKKLSELPTTSNVAASDRVLVLRTPSGNASTRTITVDNLTSSIRYANTSVAGLIKVGNNLSINATGFLGAVVPESIIANTSVAGSVKVGNNLSINATGFLSVNVANTTTSGVVKVGNNLSVNATGFLDVIIPESIVANTTVTGTVKVGNNLSVNATGFLNVDVANSINIGAFSINASPAVMNFNIDAIQVGNIFNTNVGFSWHAGNTQIAKLDRDGHLVLNKIRTFFPASNLEIRVSDQSSNTHWAFQNTGILHIPSGIGDIYRDGVSVLSNISMLSPNITYTGVFNGYPATIPVIKGQGIAFTANNYVLETSDKYWWDGEFDTSNYDLSGVETLNFYNLGGIKLDFRLGGKSENFLTSVNLRDIIAIQNNFYVRDLSALTTFSANNLSYVGNNFQIDTMDNANTQFNFPNLKTIINNFYYTNNDTLENTPQFPALETVQNSMYIYFNSATQNTMTFDSLRYFGYGSIYQNDGMLAGPEFPALTSIDYFDMNNNDNMIDPPTFPVLETINGVFNFYGHAVVTSAPALPSLVTSNYIQINDNALMVNGFNFSSLVTVNGSINFDNNVSLTVSPTFPLLQTINGAFTIENNPLLTSGLSFPSLKTLVGNFSVNGCGFNETTINNLLVKLASLDGTNGTTSYDNSSIYLNGGTNAIPTGAGLAAKTTLEGRGCTVYVNS